MTARPKWGRAGERLGPEGEARRRQLRAQANQAATARDVDEQEGHRRWRAGLVVPSLITIALDARGLHGPEVDAQCEAAEPEVDQWEAGERYPRWHQLVALAQLTGFTTRWFTMSEVEPIPLWQTSIWHHMREPERRAYERHYRPPLMRYPRDVIDEALPSAEHPGEPV